MPFSFPFNLFAASAGVWVAAREASSEIVSAELPNRKKERLGCSQAGV